MRPVPSARRFVVRAGAVVAALGLVSAGLLAQPASAAGTLVPIEGSGSTWSSNAMTLWAADVQQYGLKVDFNPNGSSLGRSDFKNKTDDFAVSEIPYGITDNGVTDTPPSDRKFAYMPIVAGGTSFTW
jgi:ABC-type phosphate transport system substrate-binding protein